MNPVDLLAVTESLVETKDTAGRYRLPKRSPLPKFGSPKNPFAARPSEEVRQPDSAPKPVAPPTPASAVTPPPMAPAPRSGRRNLVARGAALLATASAKARRSGAALLDSTVRPVRRLGNWFGRIARKAAPLRRLSPPVQAELSLENVKVVRNDLRDSDLEVVSLRSATSRKVSAIVEPTPVQPAGGKPWTRLTGRLWHPEPTRAR